jgi:cell division septation protein DedD
LLATVQAETDADECRALIAEFAPSVRNAAIAARLWSIDAALAELSGDCRAAAISWEKAAYANPAAKDPQPLLEAARCRLSIGDADGARASAKPALLLAATESDRRLAEAYLAWAEALAGDTQAALEQARAVISGADDRARVVALWLVALIGDSKASEAAMQALAGMKADAPDKAVAKGQLALAAAPLWYLGFQGSAGTAAVGSSSSGAAVGSSSSSSSVAASGSGSSKETDTSSNAVSESASVTGDSKAAETPAYFQVGAFSSIENANKVVAKLASAGIAALVKEKTTSSGKLVWAVLVPVTGDSEALRMRIINAGYEAYPIY